MREGADVRLADVVTEAVIAAKGYDAVARVIEPLQARGITVVILPRYSRSLKDETVLVPLASAELEFGAIPVPR